jgi:hypothetical protein
LTTQIFLSLGAYPALVIWMAGIYGVVAYTEMKDGIGVRLDSKQLIMIREEPGPATPTRVLVAPLVNVVCAEEKPDAQIKVGVLAFNAVSLDKLLDAVSIDTAKEYKEYICDDIRYNTHNILHPANSDKHLHVLDMWCHIPAKSAQIQFGYILSATGPMAIAGNSKEQLLESIAPFYDNLGELFLSHTKKILQRDSAFDSYVWLPVTKLEEKLPQGVKSLQEFARPNSKL